MQNNTQQTTEWNDDADRPMTEHEQKYGRHEGEETLQSRVVLNEFNGRIHARVYLAKNGDAEVYDDKLIGFGAAVCAENAVAEAMANATEFLKEKGGVFFDQVRMMEAH